MGLLLLVLLLLVLLLLSLLSLLPLNVWMVESGRAADGGWTT